MQIIWLKNRQRTWKDNFKVIQVANNYSCFSVSMSDMVPGPNRDTKIHGCLSPKVGPLHHWVLHPQIQPTMDHKHSAGPMVAWICGCGTWLYMKRYSTLLITRKVKTQMRYHITPVRLTTAKKKSDNNYWWRFLLYTFVGNVYWYSLYGKLYGDSQKKIFFKCIIQQS